MNWLRTGIIFCLIGSMVCATPLMPLGALMVIAGVFMICCLGADFSDSTRNVSYHSESRDQHVHMHHHHYPNQSTVEGHEYSRRSPDGTTHSVRYLKRSE